MAILTVNNLARYFGAQEIFKELSLEVHAGECVALVGRNGCGKSTLLDIIAGRLEPDAGTVNRARETRLGYLPQSPDFDGAGTLWEAMLAVFAELLAQQQELRHLEEAMASPDPAIHEAAMERYGARLHTFETAGGFTFEARIGKVLGGLGFTPEEFEQPVAHLSGGQRTRALLARLLLEEPDLLLLDEPTNHLDLEGIEWLEEQFKHWRGAIVIVAHDRAFLDAVAARVLEMEGGRITAYRGNYTAYVAQRTERRARQQAAYEAQQAHIAETEAYIRRYKAGQRSKQAFGRQKRLERLERVAAPQTADTIHMNLQTNLRSGDLVLGLYRLRAGYEPDVPLVTVDEVEVKRGQRVALMGPNGSGKTTLLRTILNQLPPLAGRVRLGAAVRMGYFAQIQQHLDPAVSVLDTLLHAGMDSMAETRSFLARFGFRGDAVFKEVGVLSGGEQARVALALLTLQRANLLLLDEPTNHLDIDSQEVLQEVIRSFNGTVLLVSHDRYLIAEVATQVWALDAGVLHIFKEGYAEYAAWHQAQRESPTARQSAEDTDKARREAERQAQREQQRVLARQEKRLTELEAEIHALEIQMKDLTLALDAAGRTQDVGRVAKLGAEYHQVEAQLNRLLEAWAKVAAA